jgi:hypothetical protein
MNTELCKGQIIVHFTLDERCVVNLPEIGPITRDDRNKYKIYIKIDNLHVPVV